MAGSILILVFYLQSVRFEAIKFTSPHLAFLIRGIGTVGPTSPWLRPANPPGGLELRLARGRQAGSVDCGHADGRFAGLGWGNGPSQSKEGGHTFVCSADTYPAPRGQAGVKAVPKTALPSWGLYSSVEIGCAGRGR